MSAKTALIAPSILSADFGNLAGAVRRITESGAEWIHVDVMDCHRMVDNPQEHIESFARPGPIILRFTRRRRYIPTALTGTLRAPA